jgi:hypothetical protein
VPGELRASVSHQMSVVAREHQWACSPVSSIPNEEVTDSGRVLLVM